MHETKHDHEHHGDHSHRPRWKRVHHSWIFWVAVFLMLLAMITYVMTGDLSWGLRRQPKQPPAAPLEDKVYCNRRDSKTVAF